MLIHFTTFTGSTYEVDDTDKTMRRIDSSSPMRRDGEALHYLDHSPLEVGKGAVFIIEPLGEGAAATMRTTSAIVVIEEYEDHSE